MRAVTLFRPLLVCFVLLSLVFAEERRPQPAAPPVEIDVKNVQELRGRVGQTLSVTGDVARIGSSAAGHRFINFTGNSEFTVFISADDIGKFQPDPPEKTYSGKTLAVQGTLERFRDKLQIRVRSPDELTIIEAKRGPPPVVANRPAPIELKSVGKDAWVSPAGLRYSGYDPDGRTRKDHVLRHAKDIPDRDGPHGVFDGGDELAFAWIDAAWEKVQSQQIKPRQEEGRDVYTIPMDQRIGYMGGESGGRQGHPPLTHVFLVVRRGTTDVVTAFPK
ncbi:hypothetical protein [Planctomicrobium piriforme]|nr:hypothetical protein [Planctomicrobium piriforme]